MVARPRRRRCWPAAHAAGSAPRLYQAPIETANGQIVDAFLAASRKGDFGALLDLLDPAVTVQADASAAPSGTPTRLRGAGAVARQALAFSHRAKDAHRGLVDGLPAILVTPDGRLAMAMTFTITNGKIVAIDIIADSQRLSQLTIDSS